MQLSLVQDVDAFWPGLMTVTLNEAHHTHG